MTARVRTFAPLAGLVAVSSALALAFAAATSRADVSSTLHASVGPDFQISLTFDDNTPVRNLPAGSYTVLVNDQGLVHNFHLAGPGVDMASSIENTEQLTWTVNLNDASRYTFQCDRHPSTLNGSFTAGTVVDAVPILTVPTTTTVTTTPPASVSTPGTSAPSPPTTTTAKTTAPTGVASLLGTLTATVNATGSVVLAKSGKRVTSLRAGSYTLVIVDGGKQAGLTISQSSGGHFKRAFTSNAFVGRKTSSITLTAGKWKAATAKGSLAFSVS
jgi:hypothetical protein